MNTPTIDTLRTYIQKELLNDSDISIEHDQDLLLSGLLDSINVVRLAGHIEKSYGFNIPPEDMIMEHFGSLNQINDYISTKT